MTETMRVFQIQYDVTAYQALVIDGDDEFCFPFFQTMKFMDGAVGDAWKPPPVFIDRPRLARPDIFHLVGATGIVFGPRALTELDPFISQAGELLSIPFEGAIVGLLNVVGAIDCLDLDRTAFDGGGTATVLEFRADRIPETPIFRIPQNLSSQLFCYQGGHDDSTDFKATVERAGLTGLVFNEVWNSQTGGVEWLPRW